MTNGPWATARTYGTKDADALTRAQVALSGLLALPAKEAMYFTAWTDSAGRPLEGRCTYLIRGQAFAARWWTITLYRGEGWLVPNSANRWSVGNLPVDRAGRWSAILSPRSQHISSNWLPTGNVDRFDLTLRLYHPSDAILAYPEKAELPALERTACS